jgi:hypothetical protein
MATPANEVRIREQEARKRKLLEVLPKLASLAEERLTAAQLPHKEMLDLKHTLKNIPYMLERLETLPAANDFSLGKFLSSGAQLRMFEQVCDFKQLKMFLECSLTKVTRMLEGKMELPFALVTLHRLYHEGEESKERVQEEVQVKANSPPATWFPGK